MVVGQQTPTHTNHHSNRETNTNSQLRRFVRCNQLLRMSRSQHHNRHRRPGLRRGRYCIVALQHISGVHRSAKWVWSTTCLELGAHACSGAHRRRISSPPVAEQATVAISSRESCYHLTFTEAHLLRSSIPQPDGCSHSL